MAFFTLVYLSHFLVPILADFDDFASWFTEAFLLPAGLGNDTVIELGSREAVLGGPGLLLRRIEPTKKTKTDRKVSSYVVII